MKHNKDIPEIEASHSSSWNELSVRSDFNIYNKSGLMGRCLNTLIMCDILKVRKPDHPTCLGLEQRGLLSTWWACMTHIVYIIQVSVRTLIKIARFAIFPSNTKLDHMNMVHIWFKGLFVWKSSTPLTFSCHVRSFTFIFISFLTPEIYLCIWKNTWQIILSARFVGVLRWPPPRRNKLGPRDSMSP